MAGKKTSGKKRETRMADITIWHNPRCSKSRQTLALLTACGMDPAIRLYLEDVPSVAELTQLLDQLGQPVSVLLRNGEADYKEHFADVTDEASCLQLLVRYPKVIERPVVIAGDRAVLGRPPENVLELL